MKNEHTVLIVDDEPANLQKLHRTLIGEYKVIEAANAQQALKVLKETQLAAIITDQRMPGMSGVELLEHALQLQPQCMRLVLSGYTETEDLIDAMNTGRVYKYITKPWEPDRVLANLRSAIQHYELVRENERLQNELKQAYERVERENRQLRREVEQDSPYGPIIYQSRSIQKIMELLDRVIPTDSPILIQGETGTGKELFARHIHRHSPRSDRPFLAVNCGAVPRELIESEFFGHKRGAFTGAGNEKRGYFDATEKGTILLDEIGEAPPELQVKLLRVLQEGEIMPVGALSPQKIDIRVIASTNRDLKIEVEAGRFRQDLYFRLHVFSIQIPPLRERKEDILPIAEHFLECACRRLGKPLLRLPEEVRDVFQDYSWPGNIRELKNEIERLVVLSSGGQAEGHLLSEPLRRIPGSEDGNTRLETGSLKAEMDRLEEKLIREALERYQQNRSQTARVLGISRQNLLNKMRQFQIE